MKLLVFAALLLMVGTTCAQQDAAAFQPPVSYEAERYKAGWNKNPFTLKTAHQVLETVSFARDLAIGTYFGDYADPTIIIVNTKTNERIRLKQDQPSATGMKLGKVTLGGSRKDLRVEVTLGAETAVIRYDDNYVKQLAAAEMTKTPAADQQQQQTHQQPGASQKFPSPQASSLPVRGPASVPPSAAAQTASVSPDQPGLVPSSIVQASMNRPPSSLSPNAAAPVVSQPTGVNSASVVQARRGLIAPKVNAAPDSK